MLTIIIHEVCRRSFYLGTHVFIVITPCVDVCPVQATWKEEMVCGVD